MQFGTNFVDSLVHERNSKKWRLDILYYPSTLKLTSSTLENFANFTNVCHWQNLFPQIYCSENFSTQSWAQAHSVYHITSELHLEGNSRSWWNFCPNTYGAILACYRFVLTEKLMRGELNVPPFSELLWEHLFRDQFFRKTLPAWTFIYHQLMQRPCGNHSSMLLINVSTTVVIDTTHTVNIIIIDNSIYYLQCYECYIACICIYIEWTTMIVIDNVHLLATTWEAQCSWEFTMTSDVSVKL